MLPNKRKRIGLHSGRDNISILSIRLCRSEVRKETQALYSYYMLIYATFIELYLLVSF